ncbi:MAG TPA: helix-turn-helix domain-containing protein [Planctomycetota bacterium]|nr:helix-turn-helix domain-containing protein [Planctomycetota bacterium]
MIAAETTSPDAPPAAAQALTRGLEVLRVVSEARQPITSTEIARRVGLHQSWVSRVLKTLSLAGYVRKPDYHSFAVDYGVLTLGGNAQHQFPYMTRPKKAMEVIAERCDGLNVALATLWRGQLIYFMRTQKGHEPVGLSVGFPLHLSSVAMRLLLDIPKTQALEALRESKRRYGWERGTEQVARTPEEVLEFAKSSLRHDCVVLQGYYQPRLLGCAIPVQAEGEPPAALALSGPMSLYRVDDVLLMLQQGRREVEAAMRSTHQAVRK